MVSIKQKIQHVLSDVFNPEYVSVVDNSHKHAGHGGSRPEGETHFSIEIRAKKFAGLSRVKCHQLVYKALVDVMDSPIHALEIKANALKE